MSKSNEPIELTKAEREILEKAREVHAKIHEDIIQRNWKIYIVLAFIGGIALRACL